MNTTTARPLSDALCEERRAFCDLARDLAQKKLVQGVEEHDRHPFGELFTEAIADAGTVGFYSVNLGADYGGIEMNTVMVAAVLEQLAQYDASLAGVVFTNAAALEILRLGARDGDSRDCFEGIAGLGRIPLAFPSFDSPRETELPVVDAKGRLSGRGDYLVLGGIAECAVIAAAREGAPDYSWYLVGLASAGVTRSEPLVSLGFHACPAVDVFFDRAEARLIGWEGGGAGYYEEMCRGMSLCAAAISLGLLKGSLKSALEYTADRYQGGRQIIDWPQVRMMLGNMAVEERVGEACLQRACQERDNDLPGWPFTARAAALHIGEMAVRATSDGVQLFGGNGYMKDYPQEKRMRDARQAQSLLGMVPLKKMVFADSYIEENRK